MSSFTTLRTPRVARVLERLHADAARTQQELNARRARGPITDAPPESPQFWAEFRHAHLAVDPETGELLYLLARSTRAGHIVEFGTSFGVSTLYLASGLRDNGGGRLVGSEFESTKAAAAGAALDEAGLGDLVDIRIGDALDTLRTDLPAPIDLVLLDGAKPLYLDVLRLLEPELRPDAVVVADNAARSPAYLDHVRNSGDYLSLAGPGEDVEISLRLAKA